MGGAGVVGAAGGRQVGAVGGVGAGVGVGAGGQPAFIKVRAKDPFEATRGFT